MSKVLKGCGVLRVDDVTIELNDTTNVISVKDGVESMPIATDAILGGVIPDGTIITVSELGAITVPLATDAVTGVVTVDNATVISTAGELSVPLATDAVAGLVIPDGDIITVSVTGAITVSDASTTVKGVTVQAEVTAVPETFADESAIQTYLDGLVTALVTAGIVVLDE